MILDTGRWREGAEAAEELLRDVYRIEVAKALDPLDSRDFLVIVHRLTRALQSATQADEAAAFRRALELLDVDWRTLAPAARSAVVRAARQAVADVARKVVPRADRVLAVEAKDVVGRTRRAVIQRMGLSIGADLSHTDERIARFTRESQSNFIRDEYGRRSEEASQKARDIVAAGLERGLGRDDIASDLRAGLAQVVTGRSRSYWETVAMSFTNRARSHTQLSAFEEAGIERYRYEAVMDEVTSLVCRFMNGRVFTVERAMRRFRDVEEERDPERITELQPFIKKGADDDGNEFLFYERRGQRQLVAMVERSAVGERDAAGRFTRELSTEALEAAGVQVPPAHFRCRSSLAALTD